TAASVMMEVDLDFGPADMGGLCFSRVDSTDFTDALRDVEAVLEGDGWSAIREDDHGYTWGVAERDAFENLVTDLYVGADTLADRGYGDRLLAAVFAFEREDEAPTAYWIYSFRRGSFYPFVPAGGRERNTSLEVKLQSVLEDDLDLEEDTEYWYPLWPDRDGGHPWE
ncbi:MAG: hypothetical protein ABEJ27_06810, partial [Halodesulfurarchaeum sp.]